MQTLSFSKFQTITVGRVQELIVFILKLPIERVQLWESRDFNQNLHNKLCLNKL